MRNSMIKSQRENSELEEMLSSVVGENDES